MRRLALALALTCSIARADTVFEFPRTSARLELPDTWRSTGKPLQYADGKGGLLAITRADVPNPDAWRSETKQAYADQIEKGIRGRTPGYKRVSKKLATVNGIPALDIEATREGGATVLVRVLLYRTYALSCAIEVPKNGDVAVARAITQKFGPAPEPTPAN